MYCVRGGISAKTLCQQYPQFLAKVLEACHNPAEDTVWGVATDIVGALGSTEEGREALQLYPTETTAVVRKLARFVTESQAEIRIQSLNVLAQIFSCGGDQETSLEWYRTASPPLIQTLVKVVKQPFVDLHISSLKTLLNISQWEWGQKEMVTCPGFVEYLLDRRTETDRIGKELKYSIVCTLANSATAESVFGASVVIKFKRFEREGPFYVAEEASVVVEEI